MASLQGNEIRLTYPGLLKTTGNVALTAAEQVITDGLGNESTLSMGTSTASFTGTLDLSGATVTGLPTPSGLAPAGGTATQVLTKIDGTDYNYSWQDASGGGGGGITAFSIDYTQMSGPSGGDAIGASVRIPGGSFTDGDLLEISGVVIKNNPTGWQYLNIRISPDNTTVFGGVQIGTSQSPNTGSTMPVYIQKKLSVSTNDSRTYGQDENSFYDSIDRTVIINGDINWANDQYLTFVYYIDDAAATCTIQNLTIAKING